MNQLIRISDNGDGKKAVSARELYEFLGYNKTQWKRWYTKNILNNKFAIEKEDYVGFDMMSNGNTTKDFALSINFAKKISMQAQTEKGEEARQYFIACEEELKRIAQSQPKPIAPLNDTLLFIDGVAKGLNMNENSKLIMYQKAANVYHVPAVLPEYTESKDVLFSASELLKRNGSDLSIIKFNKILVEKGLLEEKTRKSTKGEKKFKCLTEEGKKYGENQVSPANPHETQPLYYESKFNELLTSLTTIRIK